MSDSCDSHSVEHHQLWKSRVEVSEIYKEWEHNRISFAFKSFSS